MHSENFKADFLKMASTPHATFKNTSHPHFLQQKRNLSIKITSRTCRFETCRYFKLPNFKSRLISWEWVTCMKVQRRIMCSTNYWIRLNRNHLPDSILNLSHRLWILLGETTVGHLLLLQGIIHEKCHWTVAPMTHFHYRAPSMGLSRPNIP